MVKSKTKNYMFGYVLIMIFCFGLNKDRYEYLDLMSILFDVICYCNNWLHLSQNTPKELKFIVHNVNLIK